MRPVYQQYHELKARLEVLRRDVEACYGYFPAEAEGEDGAQPGEGLYTSEDEGAAMTISSAAAATLAAGEFAPSVGPGQARTGPAQLLPAPGFFSAANVGGVGISSVGTASSGVAFPVAVPAAPPIDAAGGLGVPGQNHSLARLQEEKRALHAHLKAYEHEFQITHGRQVMHQEDILPVSSEYRRYKELKQIIRESSR
jgi:hypothetical protein